MNIRKAIPADSQAVSSCLLLAMEDIVYKFIGEKNLEKARAFLLNFVERENNQYSYQNCWVVEAGGEVVAAANLYQGAQQVELRKPVDQYLKNHFKSGIIPEDETQAGEVYLDSIGVNPAHQGKGIGLKLLQFLINLYVLEQNNTLGLLVDENNPAAKRLYLKLGFKPVGTKMFVGKKMEHLQIGVK